VAGVDLVIHLRADGVSVLLDLGYGRLPAIAHWARIWVLSTSRPPNP
jgi:hypothetical protein